jgi:hypothetical protein
MNKNAVYVGIIIGCGVELKSQVSFGHGFNANGGGTYACELTAEGAVTIWFFPKGTARRTSTRTLQTPRTSQKGGDTWNKPCVAVRVFSRECRVFARVQRPRQST